MTAVREVKEETGVRHQFLFIYFVNAFDFDKSLFMVS